MSKLIENFLETHRQSLAVHSIVNINLVLDQETLEMYVQAQNETQERSKNPSTEVAKTTLNSILAARLTPLLESEKVNLINTAYYDTLMQAIRNWCPWQAGNQLACLQVQKILLALLPAVRQKQQLGMVCQEYKEHLKTEIERQVKKDPAQAYWVSSNGCTALFEAPLVADRSPVKLVADPRSPMERFATEPLRSIPNPNKPLVLALQKYQIVSQLQATLTTTPVKSATEQIKDFSRVFEAQRALLEKDRDTLTMKFIKGVATVLSLGIAWGLGIWGVKGKTTTKKVQQVLETPKATSRRSRSSIF